jgi:hypothetical protein
VPLLVVPEELFDRGSRPDGGLTLPGADVAAATATRLARGEGKPGAHTPAAGFGPDLATAAGGTLVLD